MYRCRRSRSAALALLVVTAVASAESPVVFDTNGGDAWTFNRRVSGQVSRSKCDAVDIRSARARVNATLIGERFFAQVPLQTGQNELRAVCLHANRAVGSSQAQLWRVPLPDAPRAWIRTRVDNGMVQLDAGRTQTATARPTPIVVYEWSPGARNPAPLILATGSALVSSTGEHLTLRTPPRDGEYYVSLRVADALGRIDNSTAVFRVVGGRAQEVNLETEHPEWVDTAVLYGAAAYEFDPQNFAGIRERLDEIAALGATVVWLAPVTASAPGDFGYAVTDHFALREQFGADQEFRSLLDTAHRLGLRVIVDFVVNHFSEQHAYYLDALRNGTHSPYYDWFERDASGEVTHYFDWKHLKNLDFDHPEVRNYITAAFARFVRDYPIDGFRVDASWAVARRAPEFWPALRAELKRINPDILMLAEASAREPRQLAHGFDAAYDWTGNLGEWAWKDVFGDDGSVHLDRLRAALTNEGNGFPRNTLILRFLNNNDTGERFVSRHGRPLALLAATLAFTLPGLPLIYNGDEAGASFEPYDEGPPIRWNDQDELTLHYRRLSQLRRTLPALRTTEMTLLHTDQDQDVLAYLRPGSVPSDDLLVVLNFSGRELRALPADRDAKAAFARFARAQEMLSSQPQRLNPTQPQLRIPPRSALILRSSSPPPAIIPVRPLPRSFQSPPPVPGGGLGRGRAWEGRAWKRTRRLAAPIKCPTHQSQNYVLVVGADDKLEYRAVKLGRSAEGLRIVTQGLNANEVIVTGGLQRVRPGMQIVPKMGPMGAPTAANAAPQGT
jgi:cyclomaltodextrinase / maltogenic alpha-amylase / neopullulanase